MRKAVYRQEQNSSGHSELDARAPLTLVEEQPGKPLSLFVPGVCPWCVCPLLSLVCPWYQAPSKLNPGVESIPLVPGVPPPPNYYGFANNSFKNGYTVIETETRKIDIFKAAAGLEDPHYTERKIQVVPNNSMGQPIVPFRLAP